MDQEQVDILLVDDQPAKLLAYEVILKELGENLVVATSGREALEYLLTNEVAGILVDVIGLIVSHPAAVAPTEVKSSAS